jgi:hypothetical protein
MGQARREAERAGGRCGSRVADSLDPLKTPVAPAMVGRAIPRIRSQYYPTTRNVLLQKGGVSTRVQNFTDDKLNKPGGDRAETDQPSAWLVGEVQAYVTTSLRSRSRGAAGLRRLAAAEGFQLRGGWPAELYAAWLAPNS